MQLNQVTSWERNQRELILNTSEGVVGLSFPQADIFRLRFNHGKELESEQTFVVIDLPEADDFELSESTSSLVMRTSRLSVKISLDPLGVEAYQDGRLLLSTPLPGGLELRGSQSIARFNLMDGERIYGLGQDPMARLDHRGQERWMWQEWGGRRRSGNAGIPFLASSRGYGLLLNSSWAARFAIGGAELPSPPAGLPQIETWAPPPWPRHHNAGETHPEHLGVVLEGGFMDLFFIVRPGLDDLLKGYNELTGFPPLPPKWALGFMQCKNRYRTQEELLAIGQGYRQRNIPCDTLVIDWLWFKEFGDLEWVKPAWAEAPRILNELAEMGFHIMQAQHPFIDKPALKYHEFKEKGYLNRQPSEELRPTYDHTNPEARQAWWQEIRRLYLDGVRGYWTDMGELEVHKAGTESYLGSRERVHNIYSLLWTMGLYQNQRREFKERVFSLPRTAYAGIQRYGAALWSNDISATWEVLRDQVTIGLGVCLSGQQYWTTDIGGFFTDQTFSPELYVRWFQWGTFCPIFRTHGTRPDNEVWSFGPQAEGILTEFIRLRYRLMPYIYSLARQVTDTGKPIMRALCLDFPDDPIAVQQEHEFMFGPAFLVAPVIEPGARSRRVYLPQGEWYDFWTDRTYVGKQWVEVPAPLARLPLFVRAGSLIPMGPDMEHMAEKPLDAVEVHYYPGGEASFVLYEDDGLTYSYEDGVYALTRMQVDEDGRLVVEELYDAHGLASPSREFRLVTHAPGGAGGDEVSVTVDHDLVFDGTCTIHALVENPAQHAAELRASLYLPPGWTFKDTPQTLEAQVQDFIHLKWDVIPAAEALPLRSSGCLELEIEQTGLETRQEYPVDWGSGYATRWQVIGYFDNADGQGLARPTPVEADPFLPEYAYVDQILYWTRQPDYAFNCFGYVDLRWAPIPEAPAGRGVAYARGRIWSDVPRTACLELSADPNIKLWLNGELVFQSENFLLKQILPGEVNLKAGWNDVLLKAALAFDKPWSGREIGFNFRLVDEEGRLIEELLYSA